MRSLSRKQFCNPVQNYDIFLQRDGHAAIWATIKQKAEQLYLEKKSTYQHTRTKHVVRMRMTMILLWSYKGMVRAARYLVEWKELRESRRLLDGANKLSVGLMHHELQYARRFSPLSSPPQAFLSSCKFLHIGKKLRSPISWNVAYLVCWLVTYEPKTTFFV